MVNDDIVGYHIQEKLYESRQSLVYRGYDPTDQRPAILKILKDEYPSPEKRARFQREYTIIQKLGGDGVVEAFAIEKYQNTLVLFLEDFGGESLDRILTHQALDLHTILQLAIRLAEILEHVHQAHVIHKDINPSNIVWNPATHQLKLIDFGLSTELPRETAQFVNVNNLEGTLAYISPEQTGRMNRSLDYRSDFYSLGVTLYEMLTGHHPFETHDVLEMVHCHLAKMPRPPCDIVETHDDASAETHHHASLRMLSDIILKLMAKNAEDRYQSAFGLQADLRRCLHLLESDETVNIIDLGQHDVSHRFQIPEKLYGRTHDVRSLLRAFERVRAGSRELMLVTGEPGIGKSSLVAEIHKPITETRGYFIAGKFDQFQQQIPYSALIQAFQGFVNLLLAEQDEHLRTWQTTIVQAVGNIGKVLTDVILNLELIIGPQPDIPELNPFEAQNRFNLVFGNLVKAIAQKEHPLALFIDDMQWIDSASLNLLKTLMSDHDIGYVLLIGAYRDNEVSPSHPLSMMIEEVRQAHAVINTIALPHLDPDHVNRLISDTLQSPERAEEFAGVVYEKTHGNAFFVKELLYALYEKNLLCFNGEHQRWQWDTQAIQQLNITENVVDLLVARIRELPAVVRQHLSLAACIGNRFDLETLSIIAEESPRVTAHHLHLPLTEGLLIPLEATYLFVESEELSSALEYKFPHDRIQEAAYSLIPEREKAAIHLNIGRLLHEKISPQQQYDRIFDIVNHLNAGRTLIDDQEELLQLADLSLRAGRKAKASTAYQLALRYFSIGTELLPETCWEDHHLLTFALHREWYECTYLSGHFDEAERGFMPILEHTTSRLEKAEMYNIRIVQYTMLGKYEEAFNMGWNALKLFGIELSEHNIKATIHQEFEDIRLNLGTRKITDLIHLPRMSNPNHKATLTLLINVIPPAYQNYPDVFRFIIARMVNITLKHGTAQESCFGFVAYGVILGADAGQYRTGYEFGNVGVQLSDTFENSAQKCKPRQIFGRYVNHWRMPIQSSVPLLRQAFQYGVESGDVLNAGFTLNGLIQVLFSKGELLDRMFAEIENGLDFAQKTNNILSLHTCSVWRQFILNLQGHTQDSRTFSSQDYHESQLLADIQKNVRLTYLFSILKLLSLYLYEQYAEALSMAQETEPVLHYLSGELSIAEQNLYYSLTLCALYDTANEDEQRDYREKLNANQKQMKIWADNCPENFQHTYFLVEAEIARIEGRNWEAMEFYQQAIDAAREQEFIQHEALGNELLAKFWVGLGQEKVAKVYMADAHYAYQLWGAYGKAGDLQRRYPTLVAPPHGSETSDGLRLRDTDPSTSSDGISEELLDLATVMKASQTISGEISLNALLSKMMRIVLENAGAQRSLLILLRNNRWIIEAESDVNSHGYTIFPSRPLDDRQGSPQHAIVPHGVVNYVIRTQEALVLNSAHEEENFRHDAYIQAQQPKSILCLPLSYKGALSGILYLENNLTTGAFTTHRIQVLQMLASQAAISLEHARLYDSLEHLVQERTRELEQEIAERKQAEQTASDANQAKSEFLASVSHELRSPLNALLGYAQILHRESDLTENQRKAVDVIQRSGEHLLMVISDVLDLSKIEARKIEIQPTDFDLRRCLQSVVEITRMRARQQGLMLKTKFPDNLPRAVHGDEKCLRQVLLNLLGNAVKFTEKGSVTLRVNARSIGVMEYGSSEKISSQQHTPTLQHSNTPTLHFEISDTGIGIPEEHLDRIFAPFHQISNPDMHHNGAGLGLAISQRLIALMGGELKVKSAPGQGTTFWFELEFTPAMLPQDVMCPRQKVVGYRGTLHRILIVDDQEESRQMLKDVLLPLGFEILEAGNGKAALAQIQSHRPDLALIDVMMPELDGFETIRRIRQLPTFQQLPILCISANVVNHVREESLQAGAQDFLPKPIHFDTLLEKVHQYVPIEWIYEESPSETQPAKAENVPRPMPFSEFPAPPHDTLELLFQWAMRGDVLRLKEHAKELQIADVALRPFGEHLYRLANAYQIDEIQEFLARYMEEKS